jgi:hypothetical protein
MTEYSLWSYSAYNYQFVSKSRIENTKIANFNANNIMNKIIVILLIVSILIGCGTDGAKNISEDKPKSEIQKKPDFTQDEINEFKLNVKKSYDELIGFKDKSDFHNFGFGEGGKYNDWLANIKNQMNNPMAKKLLSERIVVGEIQSMGMEYIKSKGKETESTKIFRKDLENAFYPKKVIEPNEQKNQKLTNGTLFGKWKITNSTAKLSYTYAIYQKDGKFYGISDSKPDKQESLKRNGEIYTVVGNKFGEYYKIDKNKNMELFDKGGELKSMGYTAKYIK